MKLDAQKFARALWILAGVLIVAQQVAEYLPWVEFPNQQQHLDLRVVLAMLGNSILYAGGIVALGAIIHLLGEIRDRLPER